MAVDRQLTALLLGWQDGDDAAQEAALERVYGELRQIAGRHMRGEQGGHTLSSTALVHEAYLRLQEQKLATWRSRAHFFGVATRLMRQILVDHARRHRAAKRGSGGQKLPLQEGFALVEARGVGLLAFDQALRKLEALDARQGRVAELRCLGQLTLAEIQDVLSLSRSTVKRDWNLAKGWLHRELGGELGP